MVGATEGPSHDVVAAEPAVETDAAVFAATICTAITEPHPLLTEILVTFVLATYPVSLASVHHDITHGILSK
jgi:hypothetical protein